MDEDELNREHLLETYRSMVTNGAAALKGVIIVNGGSAVALLAFIGNVWQHRKLGEIPSVTLPMTLFIIGLFLGIFAFGSAYVTQFLLYQEERGRQVSGALKKHMTWLWASALCFLVSLTLFGVGGIIAAIRFS